MPALANVALTDTFDTWRSRTNQILYWDQDILNHANGAFAQANTAQTTGTNAGTYANAAFTQANTAQTTGTNAGTYANAAFTAANTAQTTGTNAGSYANGAFTQANTAQTTGTNAGTYANAAFTKANTNATNITNTGTYANAAFTAANTAQSTATGAFLHANSAFASSNTKYSASGGTISGDVTVTGTFTSAGIDDNATGERLQLADTLLSLGPGNATYVVGHAAANQSLELTGGSATGVGANMLLYGGTHATLANDVSIRAGTDSVYYWDDSADKHTWYTGGSAVFVLDTNGFSLGISRAGATEYARGTVSAGTVTPSPVEGNFQTLTITGSVTIAEPTNTTLGENYTMVLLANVSGGSITLSGFDKTSGDSVASGYNFIYITRMGAYSHVHVEN